MHLLFEPANARQRDILRIKLLANENYARKVEELLNNLRGVPGLDSVLKEARQNSAQLEDAIATLEVAEHYRNKDCHIGLIPRQAGLKTPDICIDGSYGKIIIEVKRLSDDSRWQQFRQHVSEIESGYSIACEVSPVMYGPEILVLCNKIRERIEEAQNKCVQPQPMELMNATVRFYPVAGSGPTDTMMLTTKDGFQIASKEAYRNISPPPNTIFLEDMRDILKDLFSQALEQLNSRQGVQVIAIAVDRVEFGVRDVMRDLVYGTRKFKFLFPRGIAGVRICDGLFFDPQFKSIEAMVAFKGPFLVNISPNVLGYVNGTEQWITARLCSRERF